MAVLAVVLSVVAILVAVASAFYTRSQAMHTRRQADSAEAFRELEAARRHDELIPKLTGEYVQASDTRDRQRPGVKLTNPEPLDLDRVYIEAISAHRADEAAIEGIYDPRTGGTAPGQETGRLRRGDSWTFDVIPARTTIRGQELDRGGTASFRCTCHAAGHEPWEVIVPVEFPASPVVGSVW